MFNSKYFSKIIYLFLVALFIYNSFGYLLLYFPARTIIKHTVFKSIKKKEIAPEDLCVIAFNIKDLKDKKYDFEWKKPGKEFKFNGKMYDIEGMELKGDSVFYKVYYDHKENILEEMFVFHVNNTKKDISQNQAQRILLVGMFYEEIKLDITNLNNKITSKIPLQKTEAGLFNHIKDVPTPPPRLIV
jgi:hypothetical protein